MRYRVLEEVDVVAPLGIRFWDHAIERQVGAGLRVVAWPEEDPERISDARRTGSGIFAFRRLPGTAPIVFKYPEPFFDGSPPQRRPFILLVTDLARRYVPVAFRVELPLPYDGLFLNGTDGSPPFSTPAGVQLLSAPTRRTSATLLAVRGTLVDEATRGPAAWALVRVTVPEGQSWFGAADEQGRFAVLFPYPTLVDGFGGSPSVLAGGSPLGERGWDVAVAVFYEPGARTPRSGTEIPEYRSILSQRQGSLWSFTPATGGSDQAERVLPLDYGAELILRTAGLHEQLVSAAP